MKLKDYKEIVTGPSGTLKRYLFESNVRDYLGENRVNEDIAASLADPDGPEFWWLNNGVTILATGASSAGKILTLHDVQIVNGLQTTESIFRHFRKGETVSLDRSLLVKVIVSTDSEVRDKIIRATNNQSLVEAASLHATDKIQRDIEEVLEREDWYYERRKNYYRNIGKPPARFVTPLYIAAGYIALMMKNPAAAARLKSRFMRTQEGYESVFSDATPLEVWVVITEVLKRTEEHLSKIRATTEQQTERFLSSWRNLVAFLCVARLLGSFDFTTQQLVSLDCSQITADLVEGIWSRINGQRGAKPPGKDYQHKALVVKCCVDLSLEFNIVGIQRVGKQAPRIALASGKSTDVTITEEFIQRVQEELPDQPWRPGFHHEMTRKLSCSVKSYFGAVDELIARGDRYKQRDGVLYDQGGKPIAYDIERIADPVAVGIPPDTPGLTTGRSRRPLSAEQAHSTITSE